MKLDKKNIISIGVISIVCLILFIMFISVNRKYKFFTNPTTGYRMELKSEEDNKILKQIEGFESFSKTKDDNELTTIIENKLKSLTQELGNKKGLSESKETLKKTKKICDIESTKCIMNMLQENKGLRSINLDNLANDDSSENCMKCKKYTELSKSLQSMIDSL
jgi:FtsZ-interacting cell division protein ZipA